MLAKEKKGCRESAFFSTFIEIQSRNKRYEKYDKDRRQNVLILRNFYHFDCVLEEQRFGDNFLNGKKHEILRKKKSIIKIKT